MALDTMMKIFRTNQRQSWRLLGSMLVVLLALAMMTSLAFADSGVISSEKDEPMVSAVSNASGASRALQAGANPSMDVALWFTPGEASSATGSDWAIRSDANPSMDVALWYAGPELSFASASQALQAGANPSMDVALWYAPGEASSTAGSSWAIRPDANPSMDVALWYLPAEVSTEDLLCFAQDLSMLCP